MHQVVPDRAEAEARLAEAIRDRLADRAQILPRGVEARADEAQLDIHITNVRERGDLVKENAKNAFITPIEVMAAGGAKTYDPEGFVFFSALGVVAGAVAGPVAAVGTEARGLYHNARLGYKPRHLICKVTYRSGPDQGTLEIFSLGAWEVVKAMKPLSPGEARTPDAFQREEAEALARVVCDKLAEECRWVPLSRVPATQGDP
jgi:hypothetical protein